MDASLHIRTGVALAISIMTKLLLCDSRFSRECLTGNIVVRIL